MSLKNIKQKILGKFLVFYLSAKRVEIPRKVVKGFALSERTKDEAILTKIPLIKRISDKVRKDNGSFKKEAKLKDLHPVTHNHLGNNRAKQVKPLKSKAVFTENSSSKALLYNQLKKDLIRGRKIIDKTTDNHFEGMASFSEKDYNLSKVKEYPTVQKQEAGTKKNLDEKNISNIPISKIQPKATILFNKATITPSPASIVCQSSSMPNLRTSSSSSTLYKENKDSYLSAITKERRTIHRESSVIAKQIVCIASDIEKMTIEIERLGTYGKYRVK